MSRIPRWWSTQVHLVVLFRVLGLVGTVVCFLFMQTRSSSQQTDSSTSDANCRIRRRRLSPLQLGAALGGPHSLPLPSSPLARYSSTLGNERASSESKSNHSRVVQRKSVCQLIPEELGGLPSDLSALHTHIDLSSEFLKRHHKPRSSPIRTVSDPQILSTNTTQPVHIPKSKYVLPVALDRLSPPPRTMATLNPRADSLNARVRGSSHIDFKTATTGVAAKAMRNEISRLVNTVEDPATKKVGVRRSSHTTST